jgi:hypothetical protein
MESINVSDLPEPVARAVAVLVESLRHQIAAKAAREVQGPARELPRWEGQVIGKMSREEIYEDR